MNWNLIIGIAWLLWAAASYTLMFRSIGNNPEHHALAIFMSLVFGPMMTVALLFGSMARAGRTQWTPHDGSQQPPVADGEWVQLGLRSGELQVTQAGPHVSWCDVRRYRVGGEV